MKWLKDINWNHLLTFYEVATMGSMRTTAKTLGLSASTLSEQVKKLEKELSLTLFTREKGRLVLTKDGKSVFFLAKEMFEIGSRIVDTVRPLEVGGYPVNIGVDDQLIPELYMGLLNRYLDEYSPYGVVNTSRICGGPDLVGKIISGHIDWGISPLPLEERSIECLKVFQSDVSFYTLGKCSKEGQEHFGLGILRGDGPLGEKALSAMHGHGHFPEEVVRTDHISFLKTLAKKENMIIPLPDYIGRGLGMNRIQHFVGPELVIYVCFSKDQAKLLFVKKLLNILERPWRSLDDEIRMASHSEA